MNKKKGKSAYLTTLLAALAAGALLLAGCPTDPGEVKKPDDEEKDIIGDYFSTAPTLTLSSGVEEGEIKYTFTAAEPSDGSVTYKVYIIAGADAKRGEVLDSTPFEKSHSDAGTTIYYNAGNPGAPFSAVVAAEKDEGNKAYSAVVQAWSFTSANEWDYANLNEGGGVFKSRGRATLSTAKTYYIDYARGSDSNDGLSPDKAWKTFNNANNRPRTDSTGGVVRWHDQPGAFQPGDHILLEANSIWNGTPVTASTYVAMSSSLTGSRGNGGNLAPFGDGTKENPIVIDLYEVKTEGSVNKVYFTSNKRPIINGNGTPALYPNNWTPYQSSGCVELTANKWWEVRHIEATNSFEDFSDPAIRRTHWARLDANKSLAGFRYYDFKYETDDRKYCEGILIENCYAHDVQSLHRGGSNPPTSCTYLGPTADSDIAKMDKDCAGFLGTLHNSTLKGNIVRRTNYSGMRTFGNVNNGMTEINFIGNYVETVFGDGMVFSGSAANAANPSRVEYNIVKDSCASPNTGSYNYAACWAIGARDTMFQYNEAYGTMYGYQDGEAWDIDGGGCNRVIYQYNYSHHNAGGCILFMGTDNNIFRFNISANDGGGTRSMVNYAGTAYEDGDMVTTVSESARSYTDFRGGQTLFHSAGNSGTGSSSLVPLIYNNTFYIGDGITCGVYGNNSTGSRSSYVRLYNNIFIKEGAGTVHMSYAHTGDGSGTGAISNANGIKNNIFFAYNKGDYQGTYVANKFQNAGSDIRTGISGFTTNGNKALNPRLGIQSDAGVAALRAQRDTQLKQADYHDPAKLSAFTGKERLRNRASMFSPTDPERVKGGMVIPNTSNATIDGAWNIVDATYGGSVDFFGDAVTSANWPIGAAIKTYTPTGSVTD
jgi:hypothetical protein